MRDEGLKNREIAKKLGMFINEVYWVKTAFGLEKRSFNKLVEASKCRSEYSEVYVRWMPLLSIEISQKR